MIPAQPVLDSGWVDRRLTGGSPSVEAARAVDVRGIRTVPTSVSDANGMSQSILRDLNRAIRARDLSSIGKWLRDRPELILFPQVSATLCRWIMNGSLRAPRGRPAGATNWPPPVIASLVHYLISTGAVRNPEQAFCRFD